MKEPRHTDWVATVWDWGPVVGVAMLTHAGVGSEQPWTGTQMGLAAGGLALGLPLAFRRHRPQLTSLLVGLAVWLQVLLGDTLHFGAFVAILVAAYSAARHTAQLTRGMAGLVVILAAAIGAGFAVEDAGEALDVIVPIFYLVGTFALGRLVRRFAQQAERLRELNAAMEQERATESRLLVATERLRMARELHDVVAHRIMLMVIQAEAGQASLARDPAAAEQSFVRVQEAGRQGLDELRNLVRMLRADGPRTAPRLDDLDALAAVVEEAGLLVELERRGDLTALPDDVQEMAFRVVQEGLTNVLKHSDARSASVTLAAEGDELTLSVCDPGPATTVDRRTGGHGLSGIGERVDSCRGTWRAGPQGAGFGLEATVPLGAYR